MNCEQRAAAQSRRSIAQQAVSQSMSRRVGRVSPQGVTRRAEQRMPASVGVCLEVGLRCANPTYALGGMGYEF